MPAGAFFCASPDTPTGATPGTTEAKRKAGLRRAVPDAQPDVLFNGAGDVRERSIQARANPLHGGEYHNRNKPCDQGIFDGGCSRFALAEPADNLRHAQSRFHSTRGRAIIPLPSYAALNKEESFLPRLPANHPVRGHYLTGMWGAAVHPPFRFAPIFAFLNSLSPLP